METYVWVFEWFDYDGARSVEDGLVEMSVWGTKEKAEARFWEAVTKASEGNEDTDPSEVWDSIDENGLSAYGWGGSTVITVSKQEVK